jgi:hypothetical protein
MDFTTSKSHDRRRRGVTLAVAVAIFGFQSAAAAGDAGGGAPGELRPGAQSVGLPYTGVFLQAGKDEQRLTGSFAYRLNQFHFDVKLTGANVSKATQRSLLFDAQGLSAGGQVSAGVAWTNFQVDEATNDRVDALCADQNKANHYDSPGDVKKAREKALRKDPGYAKAADAKAALEAELKAVSDAANLGSPASPLHKAREMAAAKQKEAEALTAQLGASKEPADIAKLRAAVEDAKRADDALHKTEVDVLVAAGRIPVLQAAIASAKEDVDKAEKRAARQKSVKNLPGFCEAESDLTEERQRRLVPFRPTFLVAVRGTVDAKSTDYFDTSDAKKKTDAVYPLSASLALGVYVAPSSLLAVRFDYGRTRKTNDPGSVCRNLPIAGANTTPATYSCEDVIVGEPTWNTKTSLRAEVRHYIARAVGFNPSFTFAWAGAETTPFAAKAGSWSIDVPLYLRFSPSDFGGRSAAKKTDAGKKEGGADTTTLALGVAFSHKATWGLPDNQTTNDVSVFLGGAFNLQP